MTFLTIFRSTASTDGKTTSDRIELDFTDSSKKNSTPDGSAFITDMEVGIGARETDLGNPDSHANDSPDTGTKGLYLNINGTFNEKTGVSLAKLRLLKWSLESKTVKGTFPESRFGLDCPEYAELNVTPTAEAAYKLENFTYFYRADQAGNAPFTIVLRRVGTPDAFITGLDTILSPPADDSA